MQTQVGEYYVACTMQGEGEPKFQLITSMKGSSTVEVMGTVEEFFWFEVPSDQLGQFTWPLRQTKSAVHH